MPKTEPLESALGGITHTHGQECGLRIQGHKWSPSEARRSISDRPWTIANRQRCQSGNVCQQVLLVPEVDRIIDHNRAKTRRPSQPSRRLALWEAGEGPSLRLWWPAPRPMTRNVKTCQTGPEPAHLLCRTGPRPRLRPALKCEQARER